jgi:hypothetical protein
VNRLLKHDGSERRVTKTYSDAFLSRLLKYLNLTTLKSEEQARMKAEVISALSY